MAIEVKTITFKRTVKDYYTNVEIISCCVPHKKYTKP